MAHGSTIAGALTEHVNHVSGKYCKYASAECLIGLDNTDAPHFIQIDPFMIIPSVGINFIHVPKAAGSTIGLALRGHLTLTDEDMRISSDFADFALAQGWVFPDHAPAQIRLDFLGELDYKNYFSFGFVRNPFDLLVSLYEYTRQTEVGLFETEGWMLSSFQRDILDNEFRSWILNCDTGLPQSGYLLSDAGALLVDFVGRTESLARDLAKISPVLGLEAASIGERINTTDHANYRSYYDGQTRACVEARYDVDLRLFGYGFD